MCSGIALGLLTIRADAACLSAVVYDRNTKAEAAARATELLERRGRPPLGVALVGTRDVPNSADYYYSDDDPYLVSSSKAKKRRRGDGGPESPTGVLVEVPAGG